MSEADRAAVTLALGRIFKLMSRPAQPGDEAEYWRCRSIVLDLVQDVPPNYAPNYVRDRNRGAQGD